MGFTAGLIFGFAFGVAMVAGLAFVMQRRSKQRIAKAADVKLLGELTQDDIKKLCDGNSPLWISFPQFERVRWLNKQLEKVWPSVAKAAGAVIKESVEPILESYRPIGISQLKFNKLFLGNVAPQIEGIRMQSLKEGQVTMDLDFRWGGDPSIVLGVYTMIGAVLPVQLKNFKFFATVRVIFVLSEEMPCISAIVVALLAKPKPEIKYTFKVIGGSLTAVPGLSDMIRDLVENIVTDQLQWPHRKIISLSADPGVLSDLEPKLQGKVTCRVVKAESLKNMEMVGKSDPYVLLYVRPLFKYKTQVIDNNLNPIWNETFNLNVEDHETQVLHFQVLDEDMGNDKTLGLVSFPISKLVPEQVQTLPLPLLPSLDTDRVKDKKDRGTLHIELLYHEYTKEECAQAMELEKEELAEKERMKNEGILNSTTDAVAGVVGGAGKLVGGAVGGVAGAVGGGFSLVGKGGKALTRGMTNSIGNISKKTRDTNGTAK
ncbi:hypothetical protein MPTK1_3g04720 [Marchantia polymorpha subsp. ruderalis]|uniref:C2 domain-containing protein n=2 Tax=Marchantia polymorpha TaxID=3197 RepID=A0A176VE83_MARPO|nr:hypothetical protein AXG93_3810s1000 [Marchantia polymorpha subsp. ruderalis]PTQ43953.1 hypothetical protein MARPO_0022s0057 [Marchantia polymorpha]BBN04449.1 hypothetical protein Mp_3g04720 [Marchantia polymorpha subsp. ruderalis]|eukprot:PTQ43953.1 hypothetical protein MARPO_0022s0057 [Marchantia polymorpha]